MQELIKVTEKDGVQLISARELYEFLGYDKSQWSRWSNKNIVEEGYFTEHEDYQRLDIMSNGNNTTDYILKIDMAKELSMLARTEKGKQARKYFVECEKKLNSQIKVPTTLREALQLALDQQEKIEEQEKLLIEQKPKVDFYDDIVDSKDACDMKELAGLLAIKGLGRNNLFQLLREKGILSDDNLPYRPYIDRGYFKIIESKYLFRDETRISFKTVVFQKGVDYVRKIAKSYAESQMSKK